MGEIGERAWVGAKLSMLSTLLTISYCAHFARQASYRPPVFFSGGGRAASLR